MPEKLSKRIAHLHPCGKAVEWFDAQPSVVAAWRSCQRGDWMLWLLGRLSGEPGSKGRKRLVLAACECARLALPHVPAGEERPRKAIETAEAWARGEDTTLADVRAAAAASYAAAAASAAASAAAAYAADAASAAAYAAYAADAASAAADAADADAADAAREKALATCVDIVRKHYPNPPRIRKSC